VRLRHGDPFAKLVVPTGKKRTVLTVPKRDVRTRRYVRASTNSALAMNRRWFFEKVEKLGESRVSDEPRGVLMRFGQPVLMRFGQLFSCASRNLFHALRATCSHAFAHL